MKHAHSPIIATLLLVLSLILSTLTCTKGLPARGVDAARQVAGPRVAKLEPPNWWVGLTHDIELLVTGENLEGAKVTTSYTGLSIARSKVTSGGRYLLCWLTIAPDTQPGDAVLRLQTPSGETSIRLPLARRDSSAGKFQGFSNDDVIYLIMVDRFADGDTSNDELAYSPGTYDRSKPRAYHG